MPPTTTPIPLKVPHGDLQQKFLSFGIVPHANSATFEFTTRLPCQPTIDVFPVASSDETGDMHPQNVIAGNALATLSTPASTTHKFRVPRRPAPPLPNEPQLPQATQFRFRVVASPDAAALAAGFDEPAIVTGTFFTGTRNGSITVGDLNVFRAGDPHNFGLTVAAYRDIDGMLEGSGQNRKLVTNDDPLNLGDSNGSFRDPFGNTTIPLVGVSDKVQIYAMGWGPNRNAFSTAPYRSTSFNDPPVSFPDAPAHDADDNGPWATALATVDLPDVTTSGLLCNLDSGNWGVHFTVSLNISVTFIPPTSGFVFTTHLTGTRKKGP